MNSQEKKETKWVIELEGRRMWYEPWPLTDTSGSDPALNSNDALTLPRNFIYKTPDKEQIVNTYGCSGEAA